MPTPTATPSADTAIRYLARQTMLTVLMLTILAAATSLVFVAPAVPRVEHEASQPNSGVVQTTQPSSSVLTNALSPRGRMQIEAAAPMRSCPNRALGG